MNIIYEFEPQITVNDFIFNRKNQNIKEFVSLEQLEKEVNKIIDSVPKEIRNVVESENWKIIITNKRNLEKDFNIDYQIFGITNFKEKEILVYAQKDPIKYSIVHEFGHIIDNYLNNISSTNDWIDITEKYAKKAVNHTGNLFTSETRNEFFADCILTYCIDKSLFTGYDMIDIVPIIDRIVSVLPYVKKEENIESSLTESEKLLKQFNEYSREYIW